MILSPRFRSVGLFSGLTKNYVMIAVLYGLTTLVVPLATQYLVNSLALSSLHLNTIVFLVLLLVFLTFSQFFRYGQLIFIEYIQRKIFHSEVERWKASAVGKRSYYILEIQTLMKSFAQAYGHLVEFFLSLCFGFMVIIILHPGFIILPIITAAALAYLFRHWGPALATSLAESDEKYRLLEKKTDDELLNEDDLFRFLAARDKHFFFIKRATIVIGAVVILSQLYLLGSGIFFIEASELSVGQLVSAELILTGIMLSLMKLPKSLEALYDFDTSMIKIENVLRSKS